MIDRKNPLEGTTGFDWDGGNLGKNWTKHEVRWSESEEAFSQRPLLIATEERHSQSEPRFAAWGQTATGRRLTIVFTIRESLIRVVSARDMSRTERRAYDNAAEAETDS